MARYFFHIKDGADLIQDPEGSDLATMEDARSQALKSARELWQTPSSPAGPWALMPLSSPMKKVGSRLCPWLKRYPNGRGSSVCKKGVWRVGSFARQAR